MGRDITLLHPVLQAKIADFQALCKSAGLEVKIGECLRSVEEQEALYAQGRTKPGAKVTNARGTSYSSMHQWGVAFDFFRNDGKGLYYDNDGFFAKAGQIGKSLGLEWGGDWKSPVDKPHFQLPDWGSNTTKLKRLYKNPDVFKKTWREEDAPMTIAEKKAFDALKQEVADLKKEIVSLNKIIAEKHIVYNYMTEIPDWAKPIVQEGMDKGIINGIEVNAKGEIVKLGITMQDIKALAFDLRQK